VHDRRIAAKEKCEPAEQDIAEELDAESDMLLIHTTESRQTICTVEPLDL
jgi:hypothetical protein